MSSHLSPSRWNSRENTEQCVVRVFVGMSSHLIVFNVKNAVFGRASKKPLLSVDVRGVLPVPDAANYLGSIALFPAVRQLHRVPCVLVWLWCPGQDGAYWRQVESIHVVRDVNDMGCVLANANCMLVDVDRVFIDVRLVFIDSSVG